MGNIVLQAGGFYNREILTLPILWQIFVAEATRFPEKCGILYPKMSNDTEEPTMKQPAQTTYKNILQRAGAVLLALAVWQILAMNVDQQLLVPTPLSVVLRLGTIWQEADFGATVWFTFRKIVAGFLLGLGFGLGLGALAGRFPLFEILFRPWAVMIKSIPVASFIIICLIWMSSSQLSVFISFLMVLPIIYTNVLQSVRSADQQLLEAVGIFRLSWPKRVLFLWLPQLKPYLLSACTVSLGISWKAGIAAEIIGIPVGSIGRMFYDAKVYFNTVDLFAWTVIVVVISVLFEKGFLALLKWAFGRLETV